MSKRQKTSRAEKAVRELDQRRNVELAMDLCRILCQHAGERGDSEGAEDTLRRIIRERELAFRHIINKELGLSFGRVVASRIGMRPAIDG